MKKKKTAVRKPKAKAEPRRTLAQQVTDLQAKYPYLTVTIRDRRAVIHWPETIKSLIRKKERLELDYGIAKPNHAARRYFAAMANAVDAAAQWPMCSCGSLCRAIPRTNAPGVGKYGPPHDIELRRHGQHFYEHLKEGKILDARAAMERIEERATEVLRDLGKQKISYRPIG